jgi:hypothetical protein
MISAASTTADTPRAHITNMAAMGECWKWQYSQRSTLVNSVFLECLRDIGLEADCIKSASGHDSMLHVRWAYTMVGEELARMYSWGNDPVQKVGLSSSSYLSH